MFQLSRRYGISLLISLLFCTYTFTNAGHFHILEEASLFAVTESVALRGELDTNIIAWTQWSERPGEGLSAFGNNGELYSKKGPAPSFLAVPWYNFLRILARQKILLGLLQGTLLWNGLITAVTAGVLWLTAVRLGYTDRTGLVLGLMYGLSTIAWPYANHFLGEPVSALALLTCYLGILAWQQSHSYGWLWLGGIAGGVAITTVTSHLPLIIVLEGYLFFVTWQAIRHPQEPRSIYGGLIQKPALPTATLAWGAFHFLAPIGLAGVLMLWYNLARFGSPFDTGNLLENGAGFTTPIWQGLWGLLVSPYRGVFWYTPLFVVSIFAFPRFIRRHRADGWVILALSCILLATFSIWWIWWGGIVWGPRFLVPLTPFWVLLLAEFLESGEQEQPIGVWRSTREEEPSEKPFQDLVEGETSLVRYDPNFAETAQNLSVARTRMPYWLLVVVLISTLVQILSVSLNYLNYEVQLRSLATAPEAAMQNFAPAQSLFELMRSPVWGQFELLRQGMIVNSDFAWLPADGDVKWLIVLLAVGALTTLIYLVRDWWHWSVAFEPERLGAPLWSMVILIPLLLGGTWLGETASDPRYGIEGQRYRAVLSRICAEERSGDAIISISPDEYQVPMNWLGTQCSARLPILGYATDSVKHQELVTNLENLMSSAERLWYVTGGIPANDPDNGVERWLAQNAYKASDDWFDDYRLVRYSTTLQLLGVPSLPHSSQLRDSNNNQVTILASKAPISSQPGNVIPVHIEYLLESSASADLRWFVQILNQQGTAVAQVDTAPDDNYLPFTQVPVNQLQVERAGLSLATDLAPGQYRIIAGLYNPAANSERLRLPDGSDFVLLSFITIE